jgi:hypothetical protein
MIRLHARLPKDRTAEGTLWVTDEAGAMVGGPARCRGKADNQEAIAHDNPARDPLKPFGDHPLGVYRVVEVDRIVDQEQRRHFGRVFLKLRPVSGDAFTAAQNARSGFGIHGGPLLDDGRLRPTNGCLRTENTFVGTLADRVEADLDAGRDVFYDCQEERLAAAA